MRTLSGVDARRDRLGLEARRARSPRRPPRGRRTPRPAGAARSQAPRLGLPGVDVAAPHHAACRWPREAQGPGVVQHQHVVRRAGARPACSHCLRGRPRSPRRRSPSRRPGGRRAAACHRAPPSPNSTRHSTRRPASAASGSEAPSCSATRPAAARPRSRAARAAPRSGRGGRVHALDRVGAGDGRVGRERPPPDRHGLEVCGHGGEAYATGRVLSSPPSTLAALRSEFPVLDEVAYLNAGSNGPGAAAGPRGAADEAVERPDRARAAAGAPFFERAARRRRRRCASAGRAAAWAATPASWCSPGSTTDGVNSVLSGLDLGPGDEVLTSDEEHPGLLVPLAVGARRRGYTVRQAPFAELAAGGRLGQAGRLLARLLGHRPGGGRRGARRHRRARAARRRAGPGRRARGRASAGLRLLRRLGPEVAVRAGGQRLPLRARGPPGRR